MPLEEIQNFHDAEKLKKKKKKTKPSTKNK